MRGRILIITALCAIFSAASAADDQLAQILHKSLAGNTQAWQQGVTVLAQQKEQYRFVYDRALHALQDLYEVAGKSEEDILDTLAAQSGIDASPASRWQVSALLVVALREQEAALLSGLQHKKSSLTSHLWSFLKRSSWYTLVIAALVAYYGWGLLKKIRPRLLDALKKALASKEKGRGTTQERGSTVVAVVVARDAEPESEPERRMPGALLLPDDTKPKDPLLEMYTGAPPPPPDPLRTPIVEPEKDDSLLAVLQEAGGDMAAWARQHPVAVAIAARAGITLLQPASTVNVNCNAPCNPGLLVQRGPALLATAPANNGGGFTGRDAAMLAGGAATVATGLGAAHFATRRPSTDTDPKPLPPEPPRDADDDKPGDDGKEK